MQITPVGVLCRALVRHHIIKGIVKFNVRSEAFRSTSQGCRGACDLKQRKKKTTQQNGSMEDETQNANFEE